jgi:hypothetical protein
MHHFVQRSGVEQWIDAMLALPFVFVFVLVRDHSRNRALVGIDGQLLGLAQVGDMLAPRIWCVVV